jgi:hypothetical protein
MLLVVFLWERACSRWSQGTTFIEKTSVIVEVHHEQGIDMDLSQTLLELEQRLLTAATRGDAREISRFIADDFTEFGASGGVWCKADVAEHLPDQAFIQRTISEFAVKPLSADTALVIYRCHTDINTSLRSSIWRYRDGRWQMVFHQGTFVL